MHRVVPEASYMVCADSCLPEMVGFCPRALIARAGSLTEGTCPEIGYRRADGASSIVAGPCGTLAFSRYR